jgi:hypothetical protein
VRLLTNVVDQLIRQVVRQVRSDFDRIRIEAVLESRRRETRHHRRTDDAVLPRNRLAVRVEARGDFVVVVRPVHVVLNVFFACPDHLHRRRHLFADLDRLRDHVEFEPPPEAAADQVVVHDDLVGGQARDRHGGVHDPRRHLRAEPDIAAVGAHMHRAVDRLHGGVREERLLIDGVHARLGI